MAAAAAAAAASRRRGRRRTSSMTSPLPPRATGNSVFVALLCRKIAFPASWKCFENHFQNELNRTKFISQLFNAKMLQLPALVLDMFYLFCPALPVSFLYRSREENGDSGLMFSSIFVLQRITFVLPCVSIIHPSSLVSLVSLLGGGGGGGGGGKQ